MIRYALSTIFQSACLAIIHRDKNLRVGAFTTCKNVQFGHWNRLYHLVRLSNVALGDCTYIATGTRIANATIGKFCSVGPGIRIGLGLHPSKEYVSTHPAFYSSQRKAQITFTNRNLFEEERQIVIGNDVWIGQSALVMDGLNIGDGAIVGAGAVVTRDVPPYAIVGGVPAKTIRFRFSDDDIGFLLGLKWWDKDLAWIAANVEAFCDVRSLRRLVGTT